MFTPIKRSLTALIITASLITPISANAMKLTLEAGKEAMLRGKIISISEGGNDFVIEYRGAIILCFLTVSSDLVYIMCHDDQL